MPNRSVCCLLLALWDSSGDLAVSNVWNCCAAGIQTRKAPRHWLGVKCEKASWMYLEGRPRVEDEIVAGRWLATAVGAKTLIPNLTWRNGLGLIDSLTFTSQATNGTYLASTNMHKLPSPSCDLDLLFCEVGRGRQGSSTSRSRFVRVN